MIEKYPYTDFNEYNLDWVIKKIRELAEEWASVRSDWSDMEQAFTDLKNYVEDYFENLDLTDEVTAILNEMMLNGEFNIIITNYIAQWLTDNITPTTPVVDTSLSISGAAADAKVTGQNFTKLNENVKEYLIPDSLQGGTHNGITYTRTGQHTWTLNGTASGTSFYNLITSALVAPFDASHFFVKLSGPFNNSLRIAFFALNNGSITETFYLTETSFVGAVNSYTDYIIRINVASGTVLNNAQIEIEVLDGPPDSYGLHPKYADPTKATLAEYSEPGFYFTSVNTPYTDKPPFTNAAFLTTLQTSWISPSAQRFKKQTAEVATGTKKMKFARFSNVNGVYNNKWFLEYYANTLYPDGTDQTNEMLQYLNNYGSVHLINGTYIINNLTMPAGTAIIGSGEQSILKMTAASGFCLKMSDYCEVSDLAIIGDDNDLDLDVLESAGEGNKVGIAFYGNYSQNQSSDLQPHRVKLNRLWIYRFDGCGIKCNNTGYGTTNNILASDVYIWNCYAGINIAYWSEYHHFTNCDSKYNVIGCINNGGNNMFVNCDFSSNRTGFKMDNSSGNMVNNSHGSAVGCTFNHTDGNTGVGIYADANTNGFIFDGCQIFFSQIYLKNCEGFAFNSCNFGDTNCNITITGGTLILFTGNVFQDTPVKSITGNTTVKSANNYTRAGAAVTI